MHMCRLTFFLILLQQENTTGDRHMILQENTTGDRHMIPQSEFLQVL